MPEVAVAASGVLKTFMEAGYLRFADFHAAERIAFHGRESDELVKLALALVVRELRSGAIRLNVEAAHTIVPEDVTDLVVEWPDPNDWLRRLQASPIVSVGAAGVGDRPLRLIGSQLYLERYWGCEQRVQAMLQERRDGPQPLVDLEHVHIVAGLHENQQAAVLAAVQNNTSVITGGPGTGKTHTVAAVLRALAGLPDPPTNIALAAPTGKAAARLEESVRAELSGSGLPIPPARTLHKLLGINPADPFRARQSRSNPLPHDLVVVDETSMVALTLMESLLDAVRPSTRLVLVGDRYQLASVDAGSVLADIVMDAKSLNREGAVVELTHNYRNQGTIPAVAMAINNGDADACLAALAEDETSAMLVPADAALGMKALTGLPERLFEWAKTLAQHAHDGDDASAVKAVDSHRLLCAHREGAYGANRWNRMIRRWLRFEGLANDGWFVGQPVLINKNHNHVNADSVFNGDSGVVVNTPAGLRIALGRGERTLQVAPHLLDGVTDLYAMTIHKAQGSQFRAVSVILPPVGSPLLTRELLYTAATRAVDSLVIYGTPEALRQAIDTPTRRG